MTVLAVLESSNSSGGSQAWGHYPRKPRKIPRTPAEPRRDPAEPSERPRRALAETPAEPSERQISSESLAEGCAPRMVTLRYFKKSTLPSFCSSYKIQCQETTVTVWAVSAVVAVSVVTATPLKLNSLFRHPDNYRLQLYSLGRIQNFIHVTVTAPGGSP